MSTKEEDATAEGVRSRRRSGMWVMATWPGGSVDCDLPSKGEITIGRGEECDLVIPHRSVSRRHAKIHVGPPLRIEDLGSGNGTMVGEQKLPPRTRTIVRAGFSIQLGDVVLLVQGISEKPANAADRGTLARDLAEVERARIMDALERCGGNQTRAAALLGVSRRTLVARLTEYDLPRPLKDRK